MTRPLRVAARLVAALTVLAGPLAVGAAPAGAQTSPEASAPPHKASGPPPLPAATDASPLTVVDQSPWVAGPSGKFTIGVRLPASEPASARLRVYLFPQLFTRTGFQRTLVGQMQNYANYQASEAVSDLAADPHGGVRLTLPIDTNTSSPAGMLPSAFLSNPTANGVYPIQIGIAGDTASGFVGQPITTFLIWVASPGGFPKLGVSLVLPVSAPPALTAAGQPARLPSGEVSLLTGEVGVLDSHPKVPVSLQVDPQTLAALRGAGTAGRSAVTSLGSVAGSGSDELLPAPYVNLDLAAMDAAGLGADVTAQLQAGSRLLQSLLGTTFGTRTWAVDTPLDAATAGTLTARGATRLVVPASSLTAPDLNDLPDAQQQTTFALPTLLGSSTTEVYGADTALAAHFTDSGDQVLQADQLLAELAMINTEAPGLRRGVAVLAPAGWVPQASFLATVLGGLQGNPLLQAETVDQLFASVPVAGGSQPLQRALTGPPAPGAIDADAIRAAGSLLAAYRATYPGATAAAAAYQVRLLISESADLSGRQRSLLLGALHQDVIRSLDRVRVPPGESITLTAQDGNVPVTVLSAGGTVHVQLQLTSEKLTFRSFTPARGSCRSPDDTTLICQLVLTSPVTTLKVPVVTRTTGVFSLELAVRSADGSLVLGQARYAVRSTAVSVVAVILMIGALILLGVWWVRDRRHGRRARQLVDPPLGPDDGGDGGTVAQPVGAADAPGPAAEASPPADGPATATGPPAPPADAPLPAPTGRGGDGPVEPTELWVDDDPVVAEFFATPAPDYPPAATPPASPPTGPADRRAAPDPESPAASRAGRSR